MDERGQVFADLDGTATEADRERYLRAAAQAETRLEAYERQEAEFAELVRAAKLARESE